MVPKNSREWDSAAYERVSAPQFSWGQKVLDRLRVRGDEIVLDAGCGTGKLTAELLARLPRGKVIAVDLSQNMIRTAREKLLEQFPTRISFVAADLQHLPFDSLFDGIFSTAAFHWVPDHNLLFRSLRQALRPGGWLLAQSGGAQNLQRLLTRVDTLARVPKYAAHLRSYRHPWVYPDADAAAGRLRDAGFENVETGLVPAPTPFLNAADYREFVSKVILHRFLENFPDETIRQQFLNELVTQAANDDPPFELDYWRLNLQGRRPV